jgi:LPS sulfotransferase NodH
MTFTYRVFYEDDSLYNYGKIRSRLIRARSREKAMRKFREMYGIEPLEAK